ncbi:MAG: hypothetical protein KF764_35485 [Labilithrix sp.]|nr:hypothetical protein [Labilithrix sp.]
MTLLSRIRECVSSTIHDAEEAASGAAAKAEGAAATVKQRALEIVSAPPAPSASTLRHAAQAAVDAARNAARGRDEKPTSGAGPGVFVGVGTSAAAGGDIGVGGQASAGYVLGAGGEVKTYGSTGVVSGSLGAAAGVGLEAGLIVSDVRDFYGDGYQLSVCPPGLVSLEMSFTRDKQLTAISVGVAKSAGAGLFHFDTHTEDTTGR